MPMTFDDDDDDAAATIATIDHHEPNETLIRIQTVSELSLKLKIDEEIGVLHFRFLVSVLTSYIPIN